LIKALFVLSKRRKEGREKKKYSKKEKRGRRFI
jgi:hypothetical protein